ncbi:hypothetical protein ACFQ5N_09905 [Lutibacter holmesii]|uniref:Uncharacterized protein n=1 Tax=Lutibacter holmesii TaxID=1137985 RepID=A0ABW3WQU8_9FLAO
MEVHGLIHQFPKEIKVLILVFISVLSIGFFGGLSFVNNTTAMQPASIETHYLGNEADEDAEIMKFKKNEREILTIVHGHILSMSVIFFLISLLLATTSINKKLKHFLMIEPFISLVLTFGGIYLLWTGVLWFKYVIIISGIFMTLSYVISVVSIGYEILSYKNVKK